MFEQLALRVPGRHSLTGFFICLVVFAGSACTSTQLTHFDDRIFEPVLTAEVADTAWLVVDSCATGIHALVEFELDPSSNRLSTSREFRPSQPLPIKLEYAPGLFSGVKFGQIEGPFCTRKPSYRDDSGANPPFRRDEVCTYIYRGQFELNKMPHSQQVFRLHFNGGSLLLAQR